MRRLLHWCCSRFIAWLLEQIGGTYGESKDDAYMKVQAQRERIEGRSRERFKVDAELRANIQMEGPASFSDLFDFGGDDETQERRSNEP